MGKIINMSEKTNDSTFISPEQTLEEALDDLRSGRKNYQKLFIITLDDSDNKYNMGFYSAKLKATEIIALLTRQIHLCLKWMD